MSDAEIDAMAAGPEMDAAVAKALGWKLVDYEDDEEVDPRFVDWHSDGYRWDGREDDDEAWEWQPSRDAGLAWEAIERWCEKVPAWYPQVSRCSDMRTSTLEWTVSMCGEESRAFGPFPVAACRAILKAAEHEREMR